MGFATKKTTWNPGPNVCNFTVTLGLQVAVVENGVRKTYSARYYNPATGRFVSRDPENGDEFDPATLHKYLYAASDPVNRIDPSGREALVDYSRLFAIAAAVVTVQTYVQMTHQMAPGQLQALGIEISCMLNSDASKLSAYVALAVQYGGNGEVFPVGPCTWSFAGRKKKGDPVPYPPPVNPGPGNQPNGCGPCPPPIPAWCASGSAHGGIGSHFHWYVWDQIPYPDCRCIARRMSGPTCP
jgi:RHS repeat-associated protein